MGYLILVVKCYLSVTQEVCNRSCVSQQVNLCIRVHTAHVWQYISWMQLCTMSNIRASM